VIPLPPCGTYQGIDFFDKMLGQIPLGIPRGKTVTNYKGVGQNRSKFPTQGMKIWVKSPGMAHMGEGNHVDWCITAW